MKSLITRNVYLGLLCSLLTTSVGCNEIESVMLETGKKAVQVADAMAQKSSEVGKVIQDQATADKGSDKGTVAESAKETKVIQSKAGSVSDPLAAIKTQATDKASELAKAAQAKLGEVSKSVEVAANSTAEKAVAMKEEATGKATELAKAAETKATEAATAAKEAADSAATKAAAMKTDAANKANELTKAAEAKAAEAATAAKEAADSVATKAAAMKTEAANKVNELAKAAKTKAADSRPTKSKATTPPWVGASVRNENLEIYKMVPSSPADESELAIGDKIVSVEGIQVRDTNELKTQIRKYTPGQKIRMVVNRGGVERSLFLTLGSQTDRSSAK